jgi:uncharacterized membrane-anchored protein
MKNKKSLLILLNLFLLLAFFNWSIYKKEKTLAHGKLVLLELAPVDPRSLMQGDYMVLSYTISATNWQEEIPNRGFCIVKIDENNVAHKIRLQDNFLPLNDGEFAIKYFKSDFRLNIGAESFFFQEGHAEFYDQARYGALRVDDVGNSILVGLYDVDFKFIKAQ